MTDTPIYEQLRQHIDQLPVPFPKTESGKEISLLKRLFNPEEARIALALNAVPETVKKINDRLKPSHFTEERLSEILTDLAKRGAIVSGNVKHQGKVYTGYSRAPLAVGMFELQVNQLTPEYVSDFRQYMDDGFRDAIFTPKTSQLRTVPINRQVTVENKVAAYDDIRLYIKNHPGPFAVMNCVCREGNSVTGNSCRHGEFRETCLSVGKGAISMSNNGHARLIPQDEMIGLIDRAEKTGLVVQPENTKNPKYICCCCSDCCELLSNAKKLSAPAVVFDSNYQITIDVDKCNGCTLCVRRCPMDAMTFTADAALVDYNRCIGCGVCAVTCKPEALKLTPKTEIKTPANQSSGMYLRMMIDRFGPINTLKKGVKLIFGGKI